MTTATSRAIDLTDSCRSVGSLTKLRIPGGHDDNEDGDNGQKTGASSAATGAATATAVVFDVLPLWALPFLGFVDDVYYHDPMIPILSSATHPSSQIKPNGNTTPPVTDLFGL